MDALHIALKACIALLLKLVNIIVHGVGYYLLNAVQKVNLVYWSSFGTKVSLKISLLGLNLSHSPIITMENIEFENLRHQFVTMRILVILINDPEVPTRHPELLAFLAYLSDFVLRILIILI